MKPTKHCARAELLGPFIAGLSAPAVWPRPRTSEHPRSVEVTDRQEAKSTARSRPVTRVLESALAEVAKLPPDEQDVLATLLLDEIKSEQRRANSLARSQALLESLADEALAEFKAGKTKPLDKSL